MRRAAHLPRLLLVAVALALPTTLFLAASASAQPPSPEAFMTRVLRLTVEARYAEAWSLLHPGHQRFAPRARFVRCRSTDPTIAPYRLVSARFVAKRYVQIASPGVPQRTSTQIVLRFRMADGQGRTFPAADATVRAVWIDTRWAWVLPDTDIPAFRAGRCPA